MCCRRICFEELTFIEKKWKTQKNGFKIRVLYRFLLLYFDIFFIKNLSMAFTGVVKRSS